MGLESHQERLDRLVRDYGYRSGAFDYYYHLQPYDPSYKYLYPPDLVRALEIEEQQYFEEAAEHEAAEQEAAKKTPPSTHSGE